MLDVQPWAIGLICILFPILGFVFSAWYAKITSDVKINPKGFEVDGSSLLQADSETLGKVWNIYNLVYDGAHSFLYAEYKYIGVFCFFFGILIIVLLGAIDNWKNGALTCLAFVVGCFTSVLAGFLGMKIGVYANARVSVRAIRGLAEAFNTSFKAAVVMGFVLCGLGILNLYLLILIYWAIYPDSMKNDPTADQQHIMEQTHAMFEAIAGFGLGGSCIGLFGRVGGGIYTKAADVGADLVGKVESNLDEDDPRNPACIADNVGDNVGDIAGMGADLFGSFAEASCAALVIGSQSVNMYNEWTAIAFPLTISACGLIVCIITTFAATHLTKVTRNEMIEPTLKRQLLISTVLMTPVLYVLTDVFLPSEFDIAGKKVKNWAVFVSGACGLWSGLAIGYITEYYTSYGWGPVKDVASSCETGAATNIIYGLALGYKSTIIPVICLGITVFVSHSLAGYYGVAIAALGILSTLSIGLTIDAFGPICDNAGGIAEMAGLPHEVRDRTDALDAAGNTTAAIGKGFAIASAALVSLALFSGFVTIVQSNSKGSGELLKVVDILKPLPFTGLLIGAMLPYWFSALTMKSVGKAALIMVKEVRRQFAEDPGIKDGTSIPDYDKCIRISTDASLKEMGPPGALVMFTPLIVGFLFGVEMLAGVLAGALVSGVQMAISCSNTGGAWDNAKKYIEKGSFGSANSKGSNMHKAAVIGDTVGDPLKDTSGPSLNILIKLMAIISLVFANAFPTNEGGLLGKAFGYS